jgi:hypothetical protein
VANNPIVKKSVKFSRQLTQDIPMTDFVESSDQTQPVTPSPLVICSRLGHPSSESATTESEPISSSNSLPTKSTFERAESTASNSVSNFNSILKPNKNVSMSNLPISDSKPDQPALTSAQASSLQDLTAPTVAPVVHACQTNSITNYFKVASATTFSPLGKSSITITKKKQNNNES